MTWVSLALALVKIATMIFDSVRTAASEKAGEDREKLRSLATMQAVSTALKEVTERHDKMTDAEIKAEIAAAGDFRD